MYAGVAGLSNQIGLSKAVMISALLAWVIVPLGAATFLFSRRQL